MATVDYIYIYMQHPATSSEERRGAEQPESAHPVQKDVLGTMLVGTATGDPPNPLALWGTPGPGHPTPHPYYIFKSLNGVRFLDRIWLNRCRKSGFLDSPAGFLDVRWWGS